MGAMFPALSIKPPESPLQQFGQAQQIVAGQQQIQSQQLENQIRQRQLADQDALTRAMVNWNGTATNPGELSMNVLKAGGSYAAAQKAYSDALSMKEKASQIAKDHAATALSNADATAKQNDQYRGRLLNIVGIADPAAKQAQWDAELTKEEQAGTIQPGTPSAPIPRRRTSHSYGESLRVRFPACQRSAGQAENGARRMENGGR